MTSLTWIITAFVQSRVLDSFVIRDPEDQIANVRNARACEIRSDILGRAAHRSCDRCGAILGRLLNICHAKIYISDSFITLRICQGKT
ncbi:hypothetical protein HDV57DRAFT_500755 [Trichoderma longibrachiatum]